ncbi:MAG TPA: winged helix-turn-helix domain-containing protein [Caulobacteraceae bacterium]|nr:winged helix-turn-helix domain-containing protein [Caulobacteraceae bacterium]
MSDSKLDLAAQSDFQLGGLWVLPSLCRVGRGADEVRVEPKVMEALVVFHRAAGATLSREKLIEECWGGRIVSDDAVARLIAKVRRLAQSREGGAHFALETLPKVGFRLTWPPSGEPANLAADGSGPKRGKPSLAVLPFANLGPDPGQDYFAVGMTEEIVTALGRIRSIFVTGSGSTRGLGAAADPFEAARRLGVDYILEGSVRRSGAAVRICVTLTDAGRKAQVWGERFEGALDDVFALQDRVALGVAGVIEPAVRAVELGYAARRPVDNLGCYELHLQAAALRATLRKAEVLKAIELLDRALALDPGFAPALGQAASCHSLMVLHNWSEQPEFHRRQGLAMAERAISTGSDDAAVLAQTANALMELDNDLARARALIGRAVSLNPGCAYAWFVGGIAALMAGDGDAAARHFHEAAQLDPLSPLGEMAQAHLAMARLAQGDFLEAARLHRETTYRTPRIHLMMAAVHGDLGNVEEARRELALYTAATDVPPEVMVGRSVHHLALRNRILEGLGHAGCARAGAGRPPLAEDQ